MVGAWCSEAKADEGPRHRLSEGMTIYDAYWARCAPLVLCYYWGSPKWLWRVFELSSAHPILFFVFYVERYTQTWLQTWRGEGYFFRACSIILKRVGLTVSLNQRLAYSCALLIVTLFFNPNIPPWACLINVSPETVNTEFGVDIGSHSTHLNNNIESRVKLWVNKACSLVWAARSHHCPMIDSPISSVGEWFGVFLAVRI